MDKIEKTKKPKIIVAFEVISAISTASALYGMTKSFISVSPVLEYIAFGIFLIMGYAVSFFLQEEFNKNGLIWWSVGLSLALSFSYPQNAKPLLSIVENTKYAQIDPLYYTYIEKIKKYGSKEGKDIESLRDRNITLNSKLNTLIIEHNANNQSLISSITRKVNRDYESAKTHHRYGEWWKRVGVQTGCYSVRAKLAGNEALKQARKECLINYYVSQKVKPSKEIESLKNEITKINSEVRLILSQTSKNDAQLKKYQALKTSVENRAKKELPSETSVKFQLWILGLILEGFLSIRLIMDFIKKRKFEKEARNLTSSIVSPTAMPPIIKFLIDYTEGKNETLEKIVIRQTHPAKGKPYAIANSFIGAFLALHTLKKGIQCFTDLRADDILRVNGRSRKAKNEKGKWVTTYVDTYYSETLDKHIRTIGSTATTLRIRGKQISPQDYTLRYLSKLEKEYNGDLRFISPEGFIFILKAFIEKIYKKEVVKK